MINTYALEPRYDSRQSFYGKARVQDIGGALYLISYDTQVARLIPGYNEAQVQVFGTYSATTLRHIKEFLKQNGFKAETAKQIMADYGTGENTHLANAESAGAGRQNV